MRTADDMSTIESGAQAATNTDQVVLQSLSAAATASGAGDFEKQDHHLCLCPISNKLMELPAFLIPSGQTVNEDVAIDLVSKQSPYPGTDIVIKQYVPNLLAKHLIEMYQLPVERRDKEKESNLYCCPVTNEVFHTAVILIPTGITVEESIAKTLMASTKRCPTMGSAITEYIPNPLVQTLTDLYVTRNDKIIRFNPNIANLYTKVPAKPMAPSIEPIADEKELPLLPALAVVIGNRPSPIAHVANQQNRAHTVINCALVGAKDAGKADFIFNIADDENMQVRSNQVYIQGDRRFQIIDLGYPQALDIANNPATNLILIFGRRQEALKQWANMVMAKCTGINPQLFIVDYNSHSKAVDLIPIELDVIKDWEVPQLPHIVDLRQVARNLMDQLVESMPVPAELAVRVIRVAPVPAGRSVYPPPLVAAQPTANRAAQNGNGSAAAPPKTKCVVM